jgi:DHA2 family multidrug resistance protein
MLIIVALRYLPPKNEAIWARRLRAHCNLWAALGTPLAALWTEYVGWQMAFWQIVPLGIAAVWRSSMGFRPIR